jgi:hypothetical protein
VDSLCTSRTPKCCADNADARMVSASGGALSSCFITTEGLDASAVPAPLRAWTPVYPVITSSRSCRSRDHEASLFARRVLCGSVVRLCSRIAFPETCRQTV